MEKIWTLETHQWSLEIRQRALEIHHWTLEIRHWKVQWRVWKLEISHWNTIYPLAIPKPDGFNIGDGHLTVFNKGLNLPKSNFIPAGGRDF